MYEIFVDDAVIVLTNKLSKETDFKLFLLDTCPLGTLLKQLAKEKLTKVHLYHPDAELLLKKCKSKITTIPAAGGVVTNSRKEVLFIYRNNKWDLPKGKVTRGETTEQAAVREVEEETGVKRLGLDRFLKKTYHIFKRNGAYRLKETYWYAMHTDYDGAFLPQQSEGIEEVSWKNSRQVQTALQNSYPNIVQLFTEYY